MRRDNIFIVIFLFCLTYLFTCCSSEHEPLDKLNVEKEDNNIQNADNSYEYKVAKLIINTENSAPILGKDKKSYVNCTINIDSDNKEWIYKGSGRIRGRGNSTWLWYPKKPYRIKLDESSEILGLKSEKDWVLLANYRDPTHLMNTFVFIVGNSLGLPYTNHSRFVDVTLNNINIGLYQLTEQVEQGKNRVNIGEGGVLLSLDEDDGPNLSPESGDNFSSKIYNMPICIKYPEGLNESLIKTIKDEFSVLESSIKYGIYDEINKLMDIQTFIDYMIIQELVYNVEVAAPRSIYIHRDNSGLWTMGPLWDFDAGFDFDWSTMYTGHNYFTSYKELVLGTDPSRQIGGYKVPYFFTDLFKNKRFISEYKKRWTFVKDKLMNEYLVELDKYISGTAESMYKNSLLWPIDRNYNTELIRMKLWLKNRAEYLDIVINNYPSGIN